MPRIDPASHACEPASDKHPDSVLKSIGKAIFAPIEGAHGGVALPHTHSDTPREPPKAKAHAEDAHRPRVLSSIGKAMLAPIEGSHGGLSGVARHRPEPPHDPAHEKDAGDGRDPRVVGSKSDNPLESLGKAVVAPIEGADEGAGKPGSMPPKDVPKSK
jgi:hypothetical protein